MVVAQPPFPSVFVGHIERFLVINWWDFIGYLRVDLLSPPCRFPPDSILTYFVTASRSCWASRTSFSPI